MKTSLIKSYVDQTFDKLPKYRHMTRNPITGGGQFVIGADPIDVQIGYARRAIVAWEWFELNKAPDVPSLPIYDPLESKHDSGIQYLLSYYMCSLEHSNYAIHIHPPFEDYARGVLASPGCPWFFKQDEELHKRFPPRLLPGLQQHNLIWKPPPSKREMTRRLNPNGPVS